MIRKDLLIALAERLITESGKETFTEKSDEHTIGITGSPREIADLLALEEMVQEEEPDFSFGNIEELSTTFDARDILNGIDQTDIEETLYPLFENAAQAE